MLKKNTLREFTFREGNDFSLNNCSLENDGFIPEKFKLGRPTPGLENDCSGMNFFLEDRIQHILPNIVSNTTNNYKLKNYKTRRLSFGN